MQLVNFKQTDGVNNNNNNNNNNCYVVLCSTSCFSSALCSVVFILSIKQVGKTFANGELNN